jgi:hypothetical protein
MPPHATAHSATAHALCATPDTATHLAGAGKQQQRRHQHPATQQRSAALDAHALPAGVLLVVGTQQASGHALQLGRAPAHARAHVHVRVRVGLVRVWRAQRHQGGHTTGAAGSTRH